MEDDIEERRFVAVTDTFSIKSDTREEQARIGQNHIYLPKRDALTL